MPRVENNLVVENARIVFRNFKGAEGQYNREGDRNFGLLLDEELAQRMLEDGWNVKRLRPRDEEEIGTAYINVAVEFRKGRPPHVVLITSKGRTDLSEDEMEFLDWIDIATVDLIVRPYNWGPIRGETGVKAYLKDMFVTMEETVLDRKYADVREIGRGHQPLEISDKPHEDEIIDAEYVEEEEDAPVSEG